MKRNIVCLLLALALTLTGCGENGSTKELTPTNEENAASEAVDETAAEETLDETSIGPVSFTPNDNGFSMVYGNTTLHAYFKRQNVVPGDGKFVLHNAADDSVVEEIDLRDNSKCYVAEADSMFYMLGWDNGTHIVIQLKDTPKFGQCYTGGRRFHLTGRNHPFQGCYRQEHLADEHCRIRCAAQCEERFVRICRRCAEGADHPESPCSCRKGGKL